MLCFFCAFGNGLNMDWKWIMAGTPKLPNCQLGILAYSCYGLGLMLLAQLHVTHSNFFKKSEEKKRRGREKKEKIEPVTWPWASKVVWNAIHIAFWDTLRTQLDVTRSFFICLFFIWANRICLSEHAGSERARWVRANEGSTLGMSEHGESERARWVVKI